MKARPLFRSSLFRSTLGLSSLFLSSMGGLAWLLPVTARANEALGGRLEGDLAVSIEAGVSEAVGPAPYQGEALALRAGLLYVQTVGLTLRYDEGLGVEALPMRRVVTGLVELRPLFWARFANDLERGPTWLDLFVDSTHVSLGLYDAFPQARYCPRSRGCQDVGMHLGLGVELPLLPRANAPFIGLRAALRWSLEDRSLARPPGSDGGAPVTGLLTLTLGYRHLFETHLVDLGDEVAH
ncbi:MAG: hypothetical protein R3B72_14565 [Polyangiaceae bacterium]